MSRGLSMYSWRMLSPSARAEWFWKAAIAEIISHRRYLASEGLYHGEDSPHDFEVEAIDNFSRIAIQDDRDDDEAVEAAHSLMCAISNAPRGSIPGLILFHGGCGPRVRATLLKEAWTSGKSGSVLVLNGGSRTRIVSYFQEVAQKDLMDPEEINTLSGFGETIQVYRGAKMRDQSIRRTAFALSWTRDYKTARRFGLHGHGQGEGVVLSAEIPKSAILALWEISGAEPEVVTDPRKLRKIQIVERIDKAEEIAAWTNASVAA